MEKEYGWMIHNGCWSCGEAWNHEHITKLENGEYVHIIWNNTQGHRAYANVISSKQTKALLQEAESRKKLKGCVIIRF